MSYHELPITIVRQACRNAIESLERWLRRLVRETFSLRHGSDFLNARDEHGNFIIPRGIRDGIVRRIEQNPGRYPHPISATHLDEIIQIICRKDNYDGYFRPALISAFPQGSEMARSLLSRIIPPRNSLSHDNPISIRQAEQVICYCNDVIDSLKEHARMTGQERLYDVPCFTSFEDSFGCRPILPEPQMLGRHLNFTHNSQYYLRPGDKLRMSVEVDASFAKDGYVIKWADSGQRGILGHGNELILSLTEKDVQQNFMLTCDVVTSKVWHRFGMFDDRLLIMYSILPMTE